MECTRDENSSSNHHLIWPTSYAVEYINYK
nr:MAG TPA: hypothetical protein [Caudoviricetes sp.]